MICGKCHQKTSEIELYCKICGADLQIFSSEKKTSAATSTTTTEPTHDPNEVRVPRDGYPASPPQDEVKIEPTIPFEQNLNDFKIPGLDNNKKDETAEKPLYNKYFLDEEGK